MPTPETYQPKPNGWRGPRKARSKKPDQLVDPDNVNSELGPQDFIIPEYNSAIHVANPNLAREKSYGPDHDQRVIKMMTDRVVSAINYKRLKEPDWYMNLAYYLGTQDVTWNYRARQLVPLRTEKTVHKTYATRNKIRPKIKKLAYRAFSRRPDAAIKPGTASDLDRQAAAEGRSILSHCDYLFHRDHQVRRVGRWSMVVGLAALKIGWDESAAAEMPRMENGQVVGSEILPQLGQVSETIVPVFELLLDPEAREYEDLQWVIQYHVYPLSYIRDRWENGRYVKPDTGQGIAGYMESRLAAVLGEYMRGTEPGPVKHNTAVVYECWEPPNPPLYPEGRMIVCTRDVLLQEEERWPHMDSRALLAKGLRAPFAFLPYEVCPGSLYPLTAVKDMVGPQAAINESAGKMQDTLKTAWGKILIENGSQVPANAFDDARPNEKIPYARGSRAPEHLPADFQAIEQALKVKQDAEMDLDDISGLHEVSDAQTPGTVDSGVAIGKLQASDNIQGSDFASNIEEFHRQRAELEIHIVGRNYIEPRLLFISDGYFGDPAKKMRIPGATGSHDASGSLPNNGAADTSSGGVPPPPPPGPSGLGPPPASGPGEPMMPISGDLGTGEAPPPSMPPFTDDPDSAAMDVKSFLALQNGGSCHVQIKPGSALARDPETERAEILSMYKEGLFGPVGDPVTAGIVLALLDFAGSDEIVDAMREAAKVRMAFQLATAPNPAAVESQRQSGAIALENAKAQRAQETEAAKQQHEGAILALKDQLDQEKLAREQDAALHLKQMDQQFTIYQAIINKLHPELRVTAEATPVQSAAILQTMGIQTPDYPQLVQQSQADAHGAVGDALQSHASAALTTAQVQQTSANADLTAAQADQAQQVAAQPLPPPEASADSEPAGA